jgi:hypothetical protein
MGMNWHELRDLGHDRLHEAIAEAQREHVAHRIAPANVSLSQQASGAGRRAILYLRASVAALLAECRRLAWRPRPAL